MRFLKRISNEEVDKIVHIFEHIICRGPYDFGSYVEYFLTKDFEKYDKGWAIRDGEVVELGIFDISNEVVLFRNNNLKEVFAPNGWTWI